MNWQNLDRQQSRAIIEKVLSKQGPAEALFNPMTSEVKCRTLPFYRNFLQYRLTNYASLPSFSLDYLGDGSSFFHLDGQASTIYDVNERAGLKITIETILPYLRFFFTHVQLDDGEVLLVDDINDLPFMESMDYQQQSHIHQNFKPADISYEVSFNAFVVNCTLYFMGILMHSAVKIDDDGVVSILDQTMLVKTGAPKPILDQGGGSFYD